MLKNKWNLYLITEEKLSEGRTTIEVVKEAIDGGVDVIQLRDKTLDIRERYRLGKKIRELTAEAGVDFIINDRVDLALALNADGVHLGQGDLPLKEARKLLGNDKIIGVSVSKKEEAQKAEADGADYLGVGAVFSTASKKIKKEREGIGSEGLAGIRAVTNLPIVAIGGLKTDNCSAVIKSGADTISVISALTKAADINQESRRFKEIIIKEKACRGED